MFKITIPATWLFYMTVALISISCKKESISVQGEIPMHDVSAKFTLMPPDQTNVLFSNSFKEDYNYNIFTYEYLYNGCGVAAGDVNGVTLPDLYFSASFGPNKLYLNLGNLKFLDITDIAGVAAAEGFKTGVTMADVNGDGRMDIYSCRTSKDDDGRKNDHLFINKGNQFVDGHQVPVFEDQSKKLGLEDNSNTNHASFFDFDRDGDLDLFLLNHRLGFTDATRMRLQQKTDGSVIRITRPETPFESNRFYLNDHGHFKDITTKAGLVSSAFGLSALAADINQDGWLDIYVANDYIEPDYIYINNGNGTFTDQYKKYLRHSSQNSMGSDVADINNDGLVDIMVLDMKAEDPIRYKELMNVMQYDRYNLLVQYGYGRQVGRNVLQLNNGNNSFIEIGQYAGVSSTDWSWAPLLADFDNDGWKDIYITNGYRKDVTNLDYMNYFRDSIKQTGGLSSKRFPDIQDFLKYLPEFKTKNYLFINSTNLSFINAGTQAGMDQSSYSNGAAYADLDMDGDLDIIVNNIGEPAFIYRNDITNRHWLQIDVESGDGNKYGIGASVDVYAGGLHQQQMVTSSKGFFSASEPILHFGLGEINTIDSILLTWPTGGMEIMKAVSPDQRIHWRQGSGTLYQKRPKEKSVPLFADRPDIINWYHQENDFVDFKREKLLPYMLSAEGPCITTGDVNGDKLDDIYVGNGSGFPSALFTQTVNNKFTASPNPVFDHDAIYEDCGSILEDMDGDGDKDLIVISGGSSLKLNDQEYMSRYYVNDGKGTFSRVADFPIVRTNAGAILATDYDKDNDLDIIIAGRSTPGRYPEPPKSFLLRNDQGRFTDVTQKVFPALENMGMITDLEAGDIDQDQYVDIVVVGEWLPVTIFSFDGKSFINRTSSYGLEKTTGWWKSVSLADMDQDGDLDLWAGNIGLNNRLVTSEQYPVTLVTKDFDGNGSLDPVLCFYFNGKLYPYAGRDLMIGQIPKLKKKYGRYTPYAVATINDIFSGEELEGSTSLTVNTFQTVYFVNDHHKFVSHPLPYQVQLAPVFDMVIEDFNRDGRKDILMAGNFLYSETETGEMDSGNGTLLLQNADGTFSFTPNKEHGFWAQDEVRELRTISMANGQRAILTGNNKGPIQVHAFTDQAGIEQ